jgi:hypothetical protein
MAAKMFAEVVIAGSYKNLAKSTRGASKELTMFEKTAKKISAAVSAAFAGIAIAGITMLTDAIIDMAKAAAEDRKSMALLEKTMKNTWGNTAEATAGVEDYIEKVSNMTGIMDDDLRPAFAKIARQSKNAEKAQISFNRVLNIAAGENKDVNVVAAAYSKYLAGNKTALERMIPALKTTGKDMAYIDSQYANMAQTAGANDPFAKINVVLENFKEKIGTAFLPLIDKLAAWLASDDAQKAMDKFAEGVGKMFSYFNSPEGQKGMDDFLNKVLDIADAIAGAMKEFDKAKPLIDFLMWTTGLAFTPLKMLGEATGLIKTDAGSVPNTSGANGGPVYITVNAPSVNAQDVIKSLQGSARSKGVSLQSLLR